LDHSPINNLKHDFKNIWHSEQFHLYRKSRNLKGYSNKIFIKGPHYKTEWCDPHVFPLSKYRLSKQIINKILANGNIGPANSEILGKRNEKQIS
jgi:hypothetical protein